MTPRVSVTFLFIPAPPPPPSQRSVVNTCKLVTFLDQWRSVGLVFQGGFMVFMVFGGFPWFFSVVSWFFMVFGWFLWFFIVPGWFFMVFLQNVPAPNCILA